jgi:hypothetical protein
MVYFIGFAAKAQPDSGFQPTQLIVSVDRLDVTAGLAEGNAVMKAGAAVFTQAHRVFSVARVPDRDDDYGFIHFLGGGIDAEARLVDVLAEVDAIDRLGGSQGLAVTLVSVALRRGLGVGDGKRGKQQQKRKWVFHDRSFSTPVPVVHF